MIYTKKYLKDFLEELFYVLTAAFVIFALLELFWPGVVLSLFNLNWLLIFWLIDGIVLLFSAHNT